MNKFATAINEAATANLNQKTRTKNQEHAIRKGARTMKNLPIAIATATALIVVGLAACTPGARASLL